MSNESVTSIKPQELAFDGERFIPGAGVEITYHHWVRYLFARQLAAGKRVLDVASGEGYGAAFLAKIAARVDGFDASPDAVKHALTKYEGDSRLQFTCSDVETFFRSAEPASYDLVTAFEIIEHVDARGQEVLLEGVRRVLAPGGVAVISSPDKQIYSDVRLSTNPFHVREMYRDEFEKLLGGFFPSVRLFEQLSFTGAALYEAGAAHARIAEMKWTDLLRLKGEPHEGVGGRGEYLVALVAQEPQALDTADFVLLDRSRKLIGEEMYRQHLELEAVKAREQQLRAEVDEMRRSWLPGDELRRREALNEALVSRLLAIAARNQAEGGASDEVRRLREDLRVARQAYDELSSMVSLKLVQKAKRVWDRVPFVKNAVKAVAKRAL